MTNNNLEGMSIVNRKVNFDITIDNNIIFMTGY